MATETTDVAAVLRSLRSSKSDYLKVSNNKVLVTYLGKNDKVSRDGDMDEVVEFSDSVLKINKRGKGQERHLIITNSALYNFLPGKYKQPQRVIPLNKLRGVVLSRSTDEFLFQVRGEYDYLFRIVRRAEIVEVVSRFFLKSTGQSLVATFSDDIGKLVVTKDDFKRFMKESGDRRDSAMARAQLIKVQNTINRRADAPPQEQEAPVEGWLSKKGQSNNLWRRRYFHLSASNWIYFEPKTKGTITIEHGAIHAWKNNRYNVIVREAQEPSTPHHLRDILRDRERKEAFLNFCRSIYSEENPNFYCAVDEFRHLAQNSPRQQSLAQEIFHRFVEFGAPNEISAPRESRADVIEDMKQARITPGMFDSVQRVVLSIMRVDLLPQYLDFASKQLASEDYRVKSDLSADDKKVEACQLCTAKFSLMKWRNFCQYCNQVFCAACLVKSSFLPKEFAAIGNVQVRVCDVCYGILNPDPHTRNAFTFASTTRARPLNLAAENQTEMTKWIHALRSVLARGSASADSSAAAAPSPGTQHDPMEGDFDGQHLEGWLWKEDPTTKVWRKRYFVLQGERLWYYEMGWKGKIPTTTGMGVHASTEKPTLSAEEANFGGFSSKTCFAYRFNVSVANRVYRVAADSEREQAFWIEALQKAIKNASAVTSKPSADKDPSQDISLYSAAFTQEAPADQVTFVFTDVQNSTKLWEAEPDAMNEGLEKHDAILRELLKLFRGYEVKTEGDAFMVTFFNALDAILWCIAVQRALLKIDWPENLLRLAPTSVEYAKDDTERKNPIFKGIRIRMGIHTGYPNCRRNPVTGRMDYFGPVVNRSARVADSGHGGQIVCTEQVLEILRGAQNDGSFTENVVISDLGAHKYKGVKESVKVFEVLPIELAARHPFPPLRVKTDKEETGKKESGGHWVNAGHDEDGANNAHLSVPEQEQEGEEDNESGDEIDEKAPGSPARSGDLSSTAASLTVAVSGPSARKNSTASVSSGGGSSYAQSVDHDDLDHLTPKTPRRHRKSEHGDTDVDLSDDEDEEDVRSETSGATAGSESTEHHTEDQALMHAYVRATVSEKRRQTLSFLQSPLELSKAAGATRSVLEDIAEAEARKRSESAQV